MKGASDLFAISLEEGEGRFISHTTIWACECFPHLEIPWPDELMPDSIATHAPTKVSLAEFGQSEGARRAGA